MESQANPVNALDPLLHAFRSPVLMETHRPRIYRRRYDPFKMIERRIAEAAEAKGGRGPGGFLSPAFPFPLTGPLQPAPARKEIGKDLFARAKRALGLTTDEMAAWIGVPHRTAQRWEQGRHLMPASAWTLLQLAVRYKEVRHLLALRALSNPQH